METLFAQVSNFFRLWDEECVEFYRLILAKQGPNEITIFDPETLIKIDGPGSKTIKSDFYDFLWPDVGLALMRDKPFHDKRRKLWLQGTSAKSTYTLPTALLCLYCKVMI